MIYSIFGAVAQHKQGFVIIDAGGIGYKVFISESTKSRLPLGNEKVLLFTHFHVREDSMDLYGFITEEELSFFEALISVSGVGPKSGLSILNTASPERLAAALMEEDSALFQKTSGIGKKTADRIVLELRGKIGTLQDTGTIAKVKVDADVLDALMGLGYNRRDAQRAIEAIDVSLKTTDERLRDALKKIKG
jgi:Holliday junction DNA helicase RuvA